MFIDHIHLTVQSGDGGRGCDSYIRRMDGKVVPDGGDGAAGGNVIVRADRQAPPLSSFSFRQHQIAELGGSGSGSDKRGRKGKDLILVVPVGTSVYDRERQFLIRELVHHGDEVVVVPGGKAGIGSHGGRQATSGEKGKALDIELKVKLQSDVFLIGLPNSGKSSLLNALSRAHVREEAYPFATIHPERVVYQKTEYEQLTLCEMPSLYEFSHDGRGRGNAFLKHLEGAAFVFYAVPWQSEFIASPREGFEVLRKQLELFDDKLLAIPYGIILTQKDLQVKDAKITSFKFPKGVAVFSVSTKTGEGLLELKKFLNQMIEKKPVLQLENQRAL